MEEIRDSKPICHVRVIQNHRMPESFNFKMTLYPTRKAELTIITPDKIQLNAIVQEMKKTYGATKFAFRVQFNWKNVPNEIQKDAYFKAEIYSIFQGNTVKSFVTEDQYDKVMGGGDLPRDIDHPIEDESVQTYVDLIRTHIVDFGNTPNLADKSEKGKKKMLNYIKSICATPHMHMDTAVNIIDAL
jgi:hypothetical protein